VKSGRCGFTAKNVSDCILLYETVSHSDVAVDLSSACYRTR
jgi:hypothetical protein